MQKNPIHRMTTHSPAAKNCDVNHVYLLRHRIGTSLSDATLCERARQGDHLLLKGLELICGYATWFPSVL